MEQALSEAVSLGSLHECESLLSSGAEVNRPDSHGWSPLCLALSCGHSQLARFLLQSGADVNVHNPYGIGPLALAATLDDDSMLALIHDRMTPESRRQHNDSALIMACLKGLYSSVRWLLTNTSARVNAICPITGVSALHLAVIGEHSRVIELLLVFGADPSIPNALGQTSLDLAEKQNKPNLKLLSLLRHVKTSTQRTKKREINSVEPQFTANNILLDVGGDVVLRNSPNRPVFDKKIGVEPEIQALLSPSMRSVFLQSPLGKSTPKDVHKAFSPDYFQLPLSVINSENQGCVRKQPNKSRHSDVIPWTQEGQDKTPISARTSEAFEDTTYFLTLESPQKESKSSFFSDFIMTPWKNSIKKSRKRSRDNLDTTKHEKRQEATSASRKVRKRSNSLIDSLSFKDRYEDVNAEFNMAFMYSPSPNKLFSSPTTSNKPKSQNRINFKLGLETPEYQREGCQKLNYNQTRESQYLESILSPKYDQKINTFKRGKKRSFFDKIKWLKTLTKRKNRSRSMDNSGDYINFDELTDDYIDLQQLLFIHGLDEFRAIFWEHELDFSTFVTLERSDLTSIGIRDRESQDRILEVVRQFKL